MNVYHVTFNKSKKIVKADAQFVHKKVEAAFNISMEDKLLQYFDQDFEDWVDVGSELPNKAKLRVISIRTGKKNNLILFC